MVCGETQRVFDEFVQYFKDHPKATIDDAYRDIENHYAHAKSMRTAMRAVKKRKAWREKWDAYENEKDRNGHLFERKLLRTRPGGYLS